jgi:dTDP-4-dehydrorhamnose 3,5-epimerase-like enzyme
MRDSEHPLAQGVPTRAEDGVIRVAHEIVITRSSGEANGYLMPIWNKNLDAGFLEPHQCYVTTIFPGKVKGPHLHMRRQQFLTCIHGSCVLVVRLINGSYRKYALTSRPLDSSTLISWVIKPGLAHAMYNSVSEVAKVLNLPRPAWTPADPDDHPVDSWIRDPGELQEYSK